MALLGASLCVGKCEHRKAHYDVQDATPVSYLDEELASDFILHKKNA